MTLRVIAGLVAAEIAAMSNAEGQPGVAPVVADASLADDTVDEAAFARLERHLGMKAVQA